MMRTTDVGGLGAGEALTAARIRGHRARRILLAEDDDEMRLLMADALEEVGYEVSEAEDGAVALASLRTIARHGLSMPDALVLDVRMPVSSGVEVLSAVRSAGWTTPAILISGFGDDELRATGLRLGALAVLEKPFDFDELRVLLGAVLGSRPPPAAPVVDGSS